MTNEIQWTLTESQLITLVENWVSEQIKTKHPTAIKNAQFVGQQFIKMLKDAKELQTETNIDINSLSLDLENFKSILGEDWKNIK